MNIDEMLQTGDAKLLQQDDRYAVTKCGEVFSRAVVGYKELKSEHWRKLKLNAGNGSGRYLAANFGAFRTRTVHSVMENMEDAVKHGTTCKGQRNYNALLTIDKVKEIKQLLKEYPVSRIAKKYSISPEAIYQIRAGKRWGWVETEESSN